MPTVAGLEQLQALIERLEPIVSKHRGELIEAADWNTLVEALIRISRLTLAADDRESVPPHEHPDEVGIGWLDPRLRQIITGGGLKDPAVEAGFRKLRRDLRGLVSRVDKAAESISDFRTRITEVSNQSLIHEATLTRLDRKLLGAADSRNDIADLRSTLRTIETEVRRAVAVGTQLEVDGQPIDVPGLIRRVDEMETIRDRLTRPSGDLLDAPEFERRLTELQTSLVTEEDLTTAIKGVREDLAGGGIDLDAVLGQARLAGIEAANDSVSSLGAELRSTISGRLAEIDSAVDAAVGRATSSIVDDVLAAARPDIDRAVSDGDNALRAELEAAFETRIAITADTLTDRIGAVSEGVISAVADEIDARLPALLAGVESRLGSLDATLANLDGRVSATETAVGDNRTRLEAGLRSEAQARAGLRNDLLRRIDSLDRGLDSRITSEVEAARSILRTDLDASVNAAKRDLEGTLAEAARQSAATEVQVLSTSIRTDVQSVIRQEVNAAMTSVRADIKAEVDGLNRRIEGLVAAEVTRVSANIPQMVREQFDAFRPEINRILDSRVNSLTVRDGRLILTNPITLNGRT